MPENHNLTEASEKMTRLYKKYIKTMIDISHQLRAVLLLLLCQLGNSSYGKIEIEGLSELTTKLGKYNNLYLDSLSYLLAISATRTNLGIAEKFPFPNSIVGDEKEDIAELLRLANRIIKLVSDKDELTPGYPIEKLSSEDQKAIVSLIKKVSSYLRVFVDSQVLEFVENCYENYRVEDLLPHTPDYKELENYQIEYLLTAASPEEVIRNVDAIIDAYEKREGICEENLDGTLKNIEEPQESYKKQKVLTLPQGIANLISIKLKIYEDVKEYIDQKGLEYNESNFKRALRELKKDIENNYDCILTNDNGTFGVLPSDADGDVMPITITFPLLEKIRKTPEHISAIDINEENDNHIKDYKGPYYALNLRRNVESTSSNCKLYTCSSKEAISPFFQKVLITSKFKAALEKQGQKRKGVHTKGKTIVLPFYVGDRENSIQLDPVEEESKHFSKAA